MNDCKDMLALYVSILRFKAGILDFLDRTPDFVLGDKTISCIWALIHRIAKVEDEVYSNL